MDKGLDPTSSIVHDRLIHEISTLLRFLNMEDTKDGTEAEAQKDYEVLVNKTNEIAFFQKWNYIVRAKNCLKRSTTIVISTMIDISAGTILIQVDSPHLEWRKAIWKTVTRPSLKSASGQALQMNGVSSLYVSMRENIARIWFRVLHGRAIDILLAASYIDLCIPYILPMQRRTVPVRSEPIANIFVVKENEYAQRADAAIVEQVCKDAINEHLRTDEATLLF